MIPARPCACPRERGRLPGSEGRAEHVRPGQGDCCDGTRPHLNCCSMRASNAGATLNEPSRFTEAVLFEPTAWKSCEGYVYGDRHSASPATAAPPPSLPLPLSHRSRRHPAEPTRLAGSPSRMERQRRSGLWLGAWECRRSTHSVQCCRRSVRADDIGCRILKYNPLSQQKEADGQ